MFSFLAENVKCKVHSHLVKPIGKNVTAGELWGDLKRCIAVVRLHMVDMCFQ